MASIAAYFWPTHALVGAQSPTEGLPSTHIQPSPRTNARWPAVGSSAAAGGEPLPLTEAGVAASATPFDPFVGVVPPPAPVVVAPPAVAPVTAPPPPPEQAYRFLGRVTGPDGVEQILLTRGEMFVSIKVGMTLDNGYVVDAISTDLVSLSYPQFGTKASIPIPGESAY